MTHEQLRAKYRYLSATDRHVRSWRRYQADKDSRWTKLAMHHAATYRFRALDACHAVGLAVYHAMPYVADGPLR